MNWRNSLSKHARKTSVAAVTLLVAFGTLAFFNAATSPMATHLGLPDAAGGDPEVASNAPVASRSAPATALDGLKVPAPALEVVELAARAPAFSRPLPAQPTQALADAVAAFLEQLGFPSDAAAQVHDARLPDGLAGRLALTLEALMECNGATQAALSKVGVDAVVDAARATPPGLGLDPADFRAIHACTPAAMRALADLELEIAVHPPQVPATEAANVLDIWPVITVDNDGNDLYANDYALQVDMAGDDTYNNNAGSNMIDLNFSPAGSAVPGLRGTGPAEGCAVALQSLQEGDCTPLVAALVDTAGDDQYGVFETPVAGIDARCTNDLVIRRMVTIGVGFLGFGMLLDTVGNDAYNGKTGSHGAGHIFGVGVQVDRSGNDAYLGVRNAQGFSLIGDVGLLLDEAGDDDYDFYMPSALVPGTPNEVDGAGGVIDDENKCDNLPRFLQGAGDAVGVGLLIDLNGRDHYTAGCTDDFGAPGDIGAPACGQGFGATGGIGALADTGNDRDVYTGVPGRGNNRNLVRVAPSVSVDPNGPTAERSFTVELFSDT